MASAQKPPDGAVHPAADWLKRPRSSGQRSIEEISQSSLPMRSPPILRARRRRRVLSLEPRCDRFLVHFDVDVIGFTDVPLSEHSGRNQGLPFDTALRAFAALVTSPRLAGITITELNSDHAEDGAAGVRQFAGAVAAGLSRALVHPTQVPPSSQPPRP
jgi:arginase